jgi:hypothetical protein
LLRLWTFFGEKKNANSFQGTLCEFNQSLLSPYSFPHCFNGTKKGESEVVFVDFTL